MQNILLAAEGLGLSSVWLGVCRGRDGLPEKIEALLGTPRDVRVMGIAVVGYGAESKPPHHGVDEGGRAPRALGGLNERDLRYLNVCFDCPGLASLSGRK